jgi:hypothetical protein
MELKYIPKNSGYIIDRKFTSPEEMERVNTYTTRGTMFLTDNLPISDEEVEKKITEYAFDSMKQNVLDTVKKKYAVSNNEILNFYFEGSVDKVDHNKNYVKFIDAKIPIQETNFNLNFEIELKVTPRNFLKVQYNNLIYKTNSI